MSFLSAIRTTPITGQVVTYTFANSVDTTTLQPGQAFDLRTYLNSIGAIRNLNVPTRFNIIIPNGVTIGSSDPNKPVITIANFKATDKITVINNGNIYGAPGAPGLAGYSNSVNGSNGGNGGSCIVTTNNLTLTNYGNIYAGGGGGGGGGGYHVNSFCNNTPYSLACYPFSCGDCGDYVYSYECGRLQIVGHCGHTVAAINASGGSGGTGYGYNNTSNGGNTYYSTGGTGGTYGVPGGNGTSSSTAGGNGGVGGLYINGIGLCNITNIGNLLGGVI